MATTPSLTIDLGCKSAVEFAQLAPYVTGPRSRFMSGPVRQLDRDCARRFDVRLVPYSLEKARWELEQEVEKHKDKMAACPPVATKMKALIEAGDQTDDVVQIARLILEARDFGSNPYIR